MSMKRIDELRAFVARMLIAARSRKITSYRRALYRETIEQARDEIVRLLAERHK